MQQSALKQAIEFFQEGSAIIRQLFVVIVFQVMHSNEAFSSIQITGMQKICCVDAFKEDRMVVLFQIFKEEWIRPRRDDVG